MTPDEELADLQKKYALLGASTWRRPLVSPRVTDGENESRRLLLSPDLSGREEKEEKRKQVEARFMI